MTTALYLQHIDWLRSREFPGERSRSGSDVSGPGYHCSCLSADEEEWEDLTERLEKRAQCVADHDALVAELTRRWEEPQWISLWSAQARLVAGEEIPEPWAEFAVGFDFLHLWRVDGRWIALGLDLEAEGPGWDLSVTVTEIDPP
ncbi:hypothetical protein N4G70_06480 [Streptomyces sp. ASQP_92]|uniref:hypothetical protein n=1 Tax=unclassified Streptomyces TaxID=2593676 RepID=UPI0021BE59FC|nr:hypothetical protein [Streptomyces sp. ASQP_92]MCT9088514.1 hypothetical protein [Streptomyces sp. ASQP_92]